MRMKQTTILLLCLAFLSACGRQEQPTDPARYSLVIRDITIIDPAGRDVLPGRTVWIDGSEIAAITGPREDSSFDAARVVDGRNRYLVPGFLDTHVHMGGDPDAAVQSGPLFIANGVTGLRDMSADCWEPREEDAVCIDDLRRFGERVEAGETIGPHLLSLSSAIVRGVVKRDELRRRQDRCSISAVLMSVAAIASTVLAWPADVAADAGTRADRAALFDYILRTTYGADGLLANQA